MPQRTTDQNEGEGSKSADRAYRQKATDFAKSGQVDGAAKIAGRALDGIEQNDLREAERVGKSKSAGEDPELYRRAEPAWWTESQTSGWERVKSALYRDWLQTKADVGIDSGVELGQTMKDTVKQASGSQPMSTTRSWHRAEAALRYGFGAADHHGGDAMNEDTLRAEWERLPIAEESPWEEARPHVRRGWQARLNGFDNQ